MSFTHRIRNIYTAGSSQVGDHTFTYTASGEVNIDETCADSATTDITAAIDQSAMKALLISSDQDVTLNTNSPTDDTIALTANVPVMWSADVGGTNPITVDVTSLHVVNASGFSATFKLRVLLDVTP